MAADGEDDRKTSLCFDSCKRPQFALKHTRGEVTVGYLRNLAQSRHGSVTQSAKVVVNTAMGSIARSVRKFLSSSRWWLLLVGVIAALLCLPFIRTAAISDEGVLLTGAER